METIIFEKTREIKKERTSLEKKLNVKITIKGNDVTIEGEPFAEYEAARLISAIQFGFSAKKALTLLEEDTIFRVINIKDFTRRKDMYEVRSRIIGKEGKTRKTVEEISGCFIIIKEDNTLGVIGSAESIDEATTAITNLIRGSKQANVYRFLERMNATKKKQVSDLGLKIKTKTFK